MLTKRRSSAGLGAHFPHKSSTDRSRMEFSITELPIELQETIVHLVDLASLYPCSLVSRDWERLVDATMQRRGYPAHFDHFMMLLGPLDPHIYHLLREMNSLSTNPLPTYRGPMSARKWVYFYSLLDYEKRAQAALVRLKEDNPVVYSSVFQQTLCDVLIRYFARYPSARTPHQVLPAGVAMETMPGLHPQIVTILTSYHESAICCWYDMGQGGSMCTKAVAVGRKDTTGETGVAFAAFMMWGDWSSMVPRQMSHTSVISVVDLDHIFDGLEQLQMYAYRHEFYEFCDFCDDESSRHTLMIQYVELSQKLYHQYQALVSKVVRSVARKCGVEPRGHNDALIQLLDQLGRQKSAENMGESSSRKSALNIVAIERCLRRCVLRPYRAVIDIYPPIGHASRDFNVRAMEHTSITQFMLPKRWTSKGQVDVNVRKMDFRVVPRPELHRILQTQTIPVYALQAVCDLVKPVAQLICCEILRTLNHSISAEKLSLQIAESCNTIKWLNLFIDSAAEHPLNTLCEPGSAAEYLREEEKQMYQFAQYCREWEVDWMLVVRQKRYLRKRGAVAPV